MLDRGPVRQLGDDLRESRAGDECAEIIRELGQRRQRLPALPGRAPARRWFPGQADPGQDVPYLGSGRGGGGGSSNGRSRAGGSGTGRAAKKVTLDEQVFGITPNKAVLHQTVVLLTLQGVEVPYAPSAGRLSAQDLGKGFYRVIGHFGFMEDPDVPSALLEACAKGLVIDDSDVTYFLGRETLIATNAPGMALWRERLFVLIARNAVRATAFFRLPPERVVELGVQVEL